MKGSGSLSRKANVSLKEAAPLDKTHCRQDVWFTCNTSVYTYTSRAVSWLKSCVLVIKEFISYLL